MLNTIYLLTRLYSNSTKKPGTRLNTEFMVTQYVYHILLLTHQFYLSR